MVCHLCGTFRRDFKYDRQIWRDVVFACFTQYRHDCNCTFLAPRLDNPDLALAIGIFLGGLLQFLFQIPFLKKAGLLVKPKWAWHDEGVAKIRRLMIPALFGVSVSQINLLLDTVIASFLMTGSISWLYYSDRLLEFPLGLFGIAISTVILPTLARHHVNREDNFFPKCG